jgi:AcrR family transcriptional regulator
MMVKITQEGGAPTANRLDRRKARTRQALIGAAVRLIAEGRGERASIQEITEAADVGFGSFYNHFESKDQLFQAASEEVLERWGQMIDRACAGITDPGEVFAVSFRISGRLGWTHPDIAHFLTGAGPDLLDAPRGLAPRALRDIKAGQAAGRFYRLQCGTRAGRRRRGPARAAVAAPAPPRPHQGSLGRRTRRSHPAPARRPRTRSRAPRRPAPPAHRHLVTAPGTPSAARQERWALAPESAGAGSGRRER